MNNACQECEHDAVVHGPGRCGGESLDPDYGVFACLCARFVRDPDDERDSHE